MTCNHPKLPEHNYPRPASRVLTRALAILATVLLLSGMCVATISGLHLYRLVSIQAAIERVNGHVVWSESRLTLSNSGRRHPAQRNASVLLGWLPTIQSVTIENAQLGDSDLQFLTKLTSLRSLTLHSDCATDELLATLGQLPHLKSLAIDGAQFSARGLLQLRDAESLERLAVCEEQFSAIEMAVLRAELVGLTTRDSNPPGSEEELSSQRSLASIAVEIPAALL